MTEQQQIRIARRALDCGSDGSAQAMPERGAAPRPNVTEPIKPHDEPGIASKSFERGAGEELNMSRRSKEQPGEPRNGSRQPDGQGAEGGHLGEQDSILVERFACPDQQGRRISHMLKHIPHGYDVEPTAYGIQIADPGIEPLAPAYFDSCLGGVDSQSVVAGALSNSYELTGSAADIQEPRGWRAAGHQRPFGEPAGEGDERRIREIIAFRIDTFWSGADEPAMAASTEGYPPSLALSAARRALHRTASLQREANHRRSRWQRIEPAAVRPFVCRCASARPRTIIVNHDRRSRREQRSQKSQRIPNAFVVVAVDRGECDRTPIVGREGVAIPPFPIAGSRGGEAEAFVQQHLGIWKRRTFDQFRQLIGDLVLPVFGGLDPVLSNRIGQVAPAIKQMQRAPGMIAKDAGQDPGCTAAVNADFDEISRNAALQDAPCLAPQRDPVPPGHERELVGRSQKLRQLGGDEFHQSAEAEALREIGMERNAGRVHCALLGAAPYYGQRGVGR